MGYVEYSKTIENDKLKSESRKENYFAVFTNT
jgi:hypothetical protein